MLAGERGTSRGKWIVKWVSNKITAYTFPQKKELLPASRGEPDSQKVSHWVQAFLFGV